MKIDKEKIAAVVEELKKSAEAAGAEDTVQSPEDGFAAALLTKTAGATANPKEVGTQVGQGIMDYLNNYSEEENDVILKKEAGVNVPLVGSEAGVHQPDPGDPSLGKTQTTTNEVEKGIVAKDKTAIVEALVQKLTAVKGHSGGPAVIVEGTPQVMPVKAAELEKAAAAEQMLVNMFEKYASVQNEEEANEAATVLYKYASQAEDELVAALGEDNYEVSDIQKVAEALIEADLAVEEVALQKQAELDYVAEQTANIILNKFASYSDEEMQKEAEAENLAVEFVKEATALLDQQGQAYTEEDVVKVAEFLIEQAENGSAADQLISNL